MTASVPLAYSERINKLLRNTAMTTIAHSPAKATFSLRSFVVVFAVFALISVGMVWAFTSPAAPKPVGPEATAVPTPSTVMAQPAQPVVVNPQPAPVPVPTPEAFTAPTSAAPERPVSDNAASLGAPAVSALGLLLPVVGLVSVLAWLHRAANVQRRAFAQ